MRKILTAVSSSAEKLKITIQIEAHSNNLKNENIYFVCNSIRNELIKMIIPRYSIQPRAGNSSIQQRGVEKISQ